MDKCYVGAHIYTFKLNNNHNRYYHQPAPPAFIFQHISPVLKSEMSDAIFVYGPDC